MATLEKIRSKAGILVGVIGLALFAFIASDFFDSRSSMFSNGKAEVAEIAGSSISYQMLEKEIANLEEIYKLNTGQSALDDKTAEGIREQAWGTLINKFVMGEEYKDLGVVVSADELFKLVSGDNPHPIILQLFTNPETGQFNKQMLIQYLKNKSKDETGNQEAYWIAIENEIVNQRINEKYTTLISKGLTAPTFMAKSDFIDNNKKSDVSFIVERFNTVSDSALKISTSDLKDYYNSHKYLYEQNTSRDIEYVAFDVVSSEDDKIAAEDWINKIKPDFTAVEEVEAFVNANSDNTYTDKNYKKEELPDSIAAFAFSANVGDVYGPVLEGTTYKMAKLYKVVNVPDSVKVRHIFIRPKGQTEADVAAAKVLADSLTTLLQKNKGSNFDELALQYSEDRTNNAKGGDLGWIQDGAVPIKEFNDAAFGGTKGDIKLITSNAGFQIMQVTDRGTEIKKVKVAFLERKIFPSTQTFQTIYAKAVKFLGENSEYESFNASIAKQKLEKRFASIGESDKTVQGIETPRALIRWAFQAKEKAISEEPLDLGNTYVVAVLTQIRKKGPTPFELVKSEVELAVRKQKKAEIIAAKMKTAQAGAADIQSLAMKLNLPVDIAEGVSFSSFTVGNAGFEPKIVAVAASLAKGKVSEPVEGMNGVYVVSVNSITEAQGTEYRANINKLNYSFQSRATYDAKNALIKLADIKDSRNKVY